MPFLDISQVGVPIATRNPEEIRYNCIYCGDWGYHLYVNLRRQLFNCFRCGAKGRTNINLDAIAGARYESVSDTMDGRGKHAAPVELPRAIKGHITPAGEKYLANRELKESDIIRHQMYCAGVETKYFGRIVVPCQPKYGYCRYFVARAYTKLAWPKYLNPGGSKGGLFIAPDEPDSYHKQYWDQDEILLVEGPFDMLKASRHGPTAALLGKQLSNEAAKEIVSRFTKVYIMLDDGTQEQLAALEIRKKLSVHVEVEIVGCPKSDPGEMNEEDFKSVFD